MVTPETPISVIAVIALSSLTIGFVYFNSLKGFGLSNQAQLAYTTQCERLVIRFLLEPDGDFRKLVEHVEEFSGKQACQLLLDTVTGFLNQHAPYRMDRAYALRGMAQQALGRPEEAEVSFAASLLINNNNHQARKAIIDLYFDNGKMDKALKELEKALKIEADRKKRGYFLSVRKHIYEEIERAKEEADNADEAKARPFNGLASLPGSTLATGHPKAGSGS